MPRPSNGIVPNSGPAPRLKPAFTAGGDLGGSSTLQIVEALRGTKILTPGGALTPNTVLTAVSTDEADWIEGGGGGGTTGPAGGDLGGNYPDPLVLQINEMPAAEAAEGFDQAVFRAQAEDLNLTYPQSAYSDEGLWIWLTQDSSPEVVRVEIGDPNRIVARVSLNEAGSSGSSKITGDATHIFVCGNLNLIHVIDKATNEVVGTGVCSGGQTPHGIAVVDDTIYVVSDDYVSFTNPSHIQSFSKTQLLAQFPDQVDPILVRNIQNTPWRLRPRGRRFEPAFRRQRRPGRRHPLRL